jgi:hypothetical protein
MESDYGAEETSLEVTATYTLGTPEGRGFDSRRCHNPFGCTMVLELRSTQPLTKMSTRNISLGGGGGVKADGA